MLMNVLCDHCKIGCVLDESDWLCESCRSIEDCYQFYEVQDYEILEGEDD